MTEADLSEVLKGKTPVEYIRVSTAKQAKKGGGLASQKKVLAEFLSDYKIKKKPVVFEEQVSGGKDEGQRKKWAEMIDFIMSKDDPSQYFILMRDFTRWSRHTIYGPWAYRALYDAGVELVSVNDRASTGSKKRPDAQGEFLFGLWTAIGGRERTGVAEKSLQGIEAARELGKVGGTRIDTSLPWRELVEVYIPRMALPRSDPQKLFATGVAKKLRVGATWVKKWNKRFNELEAWGLANENPNVLQEYLTHIDYVDDALEKFGKKSDQYNAVAAMTSGFLKDPIKYYSFRKTPKDIAEYVSNPSEYLPKK